MSCKRNPAFKATKIKPMTTAALMENLKALPGILNISSDFSDDSSSPFHGSNKTKLPVRPRDQKYSLPKNGPKENKENISRDRSYFERVHIMPTIEASSTSSQAVTVENVANRPPLLEKKESVRCLFPESIDPEPDTPIQSRTYTVAKSTLCPPTEVSIASSSSTSVQQTPTVSATSNQALSHSKNRIQFKTVSVKGKKYLYLKKLGEGGSSEVFKILDIGTTQELALKTVSLSADRDMVTGYLNEVRVLRELQSSDRVVKLYEYEYDRNLNTLNIVLEVGETDLATFLQSHRGGAPPALVLHYWEEMLRAVQQIHEHGIVHADLKPANFLLVSGMLKLIDFGIASKVSSDATSVERSCGKGTFSYISPEALGCDGSQPIKVSFYSDVWSLGCILYSLVYGHTPFAHLSAMAKLVTIRDPDHYIAFPTPDNIPPSLIISMQQCLRYNAHHRPKVTELLQVNHIISGRGIPHEILNKVMPHLTTREFRIVQSARISNEP